MTAIQGVLSLIPDKICGQIFLLEDCNIHLCQRYKRKTLGTWRSISGPPPLHSPTHCIYFHIYSLYKKTVSSLDSIPSSIWIIINLIKWWPYFRYCSWIFLKYIFLSSCYRQDCCVVLVFRMRLKRTSTALLTVRISTMPEAVKLSCTGDQHDFVAFIIPLVFCLWWVQSWYNLCFDNYYACFMRNIPFTASVALK